MKTTKNNTKEDEGYNFFKENYIPLIISILIIIGNTIFSEKQLSIESFFSTLVPSLIGSMLVFIIFYIGKFEKSYKETYERIEKASIVLEQNQKQLETIENNMADNFEKMNEAYKRINGTAKILSRIAKGAIDIEKATLGLEGDASYVVAEKIIKAFSAYHNKWFESAKNLKINQELSGYVWSKYLEIYLHEESNLIRKDLVFTTSRVYTDIIYNFHKILKSKLQPGEQLSLFFVTSMLPNEFFNWPQAELSSDNSYYEIIGHTWNGSDEYFRKMEDLKDSIAVKRCVLITDDKLHNEKFSFLPLIGDLEKDAVTVIYDSPIQYDDFKNLHIENLFTNFSKRGYSYTAASSFVDIKKFKFYPIGRAEDFKESNISPNTNMLSFFIDKFHSKKENALYKVIEESEFNLLFLDAGLSNSVLLPELAMFKITSSNGKERWICGLVGNLRPFTDTMYIKFIGDTKPIEGILNNLERNSSELINLI